MRAVLVLALAGCSAFATEGPRPPPGPTACNRDAQPVVADALVGVAAAIAGGVVSLEHGSTTDVVVPLAISGVFGASAGYGAIQVHRCRVEHAKRPGWSLADMPAVM
jgi:hypothetical protein